MYTPLLQMDKRFLRTPLRAALGGVRSTLSLDVRQFRSDLFVWMLHRMEERLDKLLVLMNHGRGLTVEFATDCSALAPLRVSFGGEFGYGWSLVDSWPSDSRFEIPLASCACPDPTAVYHPLTAEQVEFVAVFHSWLMLLRSVHEIARPRRGFVCLIERTKAVFDALFHPRPEEAYVPKHLSTYGALRVALVSDLPLTWSSGVLGFIEPSPSIYDLETSRELLFDVRAAFERMACGMPSEGTEIVYRLSDLLESDADLLRETLIWMLTHSALAPVKARPDVLLPTERRSRLSYGPVEQLLARLVSLCVIMLADKQRILQCLGAESFLFELGGQTTPDVDHPSTLLCGSYWPDVLHVSDLSGDIQKLVTAPPPMGLRRHVGGKARPIACRSTELRNHAKGGLSLKPRFLFAFNTGRVRLRHVLPTGDDLDHDVHLL